MDILSKDNHCSARKMAEMVHVSSRRIESNIKKLKENGVLVRHGSPKNGYWEIVE